MGRWLLLFGLVACGGGDGGTGDDDDDTTGDDDDDMAGDDDDDDDGVPLLQCDDPFVACGGDATGAWDVAGICEYAFDASGLGCDDLTWEITEDRSSGSIELAAGGTYTRTYQVDLDLELMIPNSCLGGPVNCGNLASLSGGLVDSCTEMGTMCHCQGTVDEVDSASGTWVADGDELVFDGNDRHAICIQGDGGQSVDEDGTRVIWQR